MGSFFDDILRGKMLFDGSMGALLSARGHISDCPELYTVEQPEIIASVHADYIDAGAHVVTCNSLAATPLKLKHKNIPERAREIAMAAVKVAQDASKGRGYVAFDLGPSGEFMQPVGEYSLEDMVGNFRVATKAAKDAGADFVLLETMTDIAECRAACIAAMEEGIGIAASFTFEKNGRTLTGGTPECAALALWAAGAQAMGINCSGGPGEMIEPLRAMRTVMPLPVIVQPNAGLPVVDDAGKTVYSFTPEAMLPLMQGIVDAGAAAIGGCCGTTPAHIRAFAGLKRKPFVSGWDGVERICSARQCVTKEEAQGSMGEIDALDDLYDLEDERCARIDLCGLSPQEAKARVEEAQSMTKLPLVFQVDNRDALIAALRVYVGLAGAMGEDALFADLPIRVVRFS